MTIHFHDMTKQFVLCGHMMKCWLRKISLMESETKKYCDTVDKKFGQVLDGNKLSDLSCAHSSMKSV